MQTKKKIGDLNLKLVHLAVRKVNAGFTVFKNMWAGNERNAE